MSIASRHLTVDMYSCDHLLKGVAWETVLAGIIENSGYTVLRLLPQKIDDSHFVLAAIFSEGHLILHTYRELKYVAADIYLCHEAAEPEILAKLLRKFFKPEKIKTTYLKRGDFLSPKDIKPRIKTRLAPLRRIHNTGAKVIRLLSRNPSNHNQGQS